MMIPTTGDAAEVTRAAVDDSRISITDGDVVRDISPRGLEILESLNTVFDDSAIEKK